jgi:ubiquinone biosynthesis monooxygenase Coq6
MLPVRRVARAIAATRGGAPGTRPPISALARGFASSDVSGEEVVDVCVVGGGVVGTAMACLLRASPRTKHLSVTLVDRALPPPASLLDAPPAVADARVSALTPASVALLRRVGAWDRVAAARARPFTAMQVWDARAPGHVRYDASELGTDALGHVVENRIVHAALAEAASGLGVVAAAPSVVEGVAAGVSADRPLAGSPAVVTLRNAEVPIDGTNTHGDSIVENQLSSTETRSTLRARLVIGADGAHSRVASPRRDARVRVVVRTESRRGHGASVPRERRGVAEIPAGWPNRGAPRDGRPVRRERGLDQRAGGGGPNRRAGRRRLRARSRRRVSRRREVRFFF